LPQLGLFWAIKSKKMENEAAEEIMSYSEVLLIFNDILFKNPFK